MNYIIKMVIIKKYFSEGMVIIRAARCRDISARRPDFWECLELTTALYPVFHFFI